MKFRKTIWIVALIAGAGATYGGWLAYLAWRDLVTLDVRNMDVREVVREMERQTWESISVDKEIQGKVTLKARRMPLRDALQIVSGQTFSRPTVIYPLYSNRPSLDALKQALRGEVDPATHGWTNLQARNFGGPMFAMGGFGMPGQNQPVKSTVSLNIVSKDLAFATLALNRFAQMRVVPEDGTAGTVNLSLDNAPVRRAVAQLAKRVSRKWTTLYALQQGFGPGGPPPGGGRGPEFVMRNGDNQPRFGFGGPEVTDEKREEMRKQREAVEEELRQVLPADERQKLEAAQQERERQMQELANMTDEERRNRMMQMGGGARAIDQMNRNRILNSTPEQRAEMNRRMGQMRGPGGPGGGGPAGGGRPGG